ncbi:DNA topoisomerase IB [Leifsonia sp. A12D58]|uniref:DNA topoisomerase IB n=1 Tax=Leifsonia sp. A12D58 TaxID=3397674 RepID=UPI0039DF96FD
MPRLKRVTPYESPGYRRRRNGDTFRYIGEDGRTIGAAERTRVTALVIPPAWKRVWIADTPNAHILAVGIDDAGRRQYIYHPRWRATQDGEKFAHARELAVALPAARRRVTRDLRSTGLHKERVLAAAFRLLDSTSIRVGAEEYARTNGSRGLSTLLCKHVKVDGTTISLSFPAKSNIDASISLIDTDLAAVVSELLKRPAKSRLLAWNDSDSATGTGGDRMIPVTAADVNDYIRSRTGGDFTAKDFRTLNGTLAAASALADLGPAPGAKTAARNQREAVKAAADVLGNTPTVARSSYIDPTIWARYEEGETIDGNVVPEKALIQLIDGASENASA